MTSTYIAVASVLVALVSGIVTWLVSRRAKSGKIDTSEAVTLWDEGTVMRRELRDEVESLRKQLAESGAQLAEAVKAIGDLNLEIRHSRSETAASRLETASSRLETAASREETQKLMLQIESTHNDVKTTNELMFIALADSTETRRIMSIPQSDRSPEEAKHITDAIGRIFQELRISANDIGGE